MKKITILFLATFALVANEAISQVADQDKKPAVIFVEDGDQNPFNGKVYRSSVSGAARSGNGNSNDAFANQGDWSVDLVISERTPENAAQNFGGFIESGHPVSTMDTKYPSQRHGNHVTTWTACERNTICYCRTDCTVVCTRR